jgi:hypothetical protein
MKEEESIRDIFDEFGIEYASRVAQAIEEEAHRDGHHAGESEVLRYTRKYCELLSECNLI